MSGAWSGGAANWSWQRPGSRVRAQPRDRERDLRLFDQMKHERFWCDVCDGLHQLIVHDRTQGRLTMTYEPMADAAYAGNIPPGFTVAAGYYGGPQAYHVWPAADWGRFPGFRLPIWVGGSDGDAEGQAALDALGALGILSGTVSVLDMETRNSNADVAYVQEFGRWLQTAGFKVWVYGSASTVFRLPPLNGYWVASYGISMAEIDALLAHEHVRAMQYAAGPGYDRSLVKQWAEGEMWHG